jgi:hypothetical protein
MKLLRSFLISPRNLCKLTKFRYNEINSFLISVDSSLSQDGALLWWSKAFENITSYTAEELKKMKIDDFMSESMANRHQIAFQRYIHTGISSILYKPFLVPINVKSKFCEMVSLQTKPFVWMDPFKIALISLGEMHSASGNDFIVVDSCGFIETYTSGFLKILGKYKQMGYKEKLPLLYFCPSFLPLFLRYSIKFREQFKDINLDTLPSMKSTTDQSGNSVYTENYIWNSFEEKYLIENQDSLTEKLFFSQKFDLQNFANRYLTNIPENRATSLISMKITKLLTQNAHDCYFYLEFLSVKQYKELIRSSVKMSMNQPLKWLMKIDSIENQLEESLVSDFGHEPEDDLEEEEKVKNVKEPKVKTLHEVRFADLGVQKESNSRKLVSMKTNPSNDQPKTAFQKFSNKVNMITNIIKYSKPGQQSQSIRKIVTVPEMAPQNDNDSENISLVGSVNELSENCNQIENIQNFKSSFINPKKISNALSTFKKLKFLLILRIVFFLGFITSAYALSRIVS